jgi:hypothetical protein
MPRFAWAAAAALCLAASTARSQGVTASIGTLTCTSMPSGADKRASDTVDTAHLNCAFKAAASGHEERYSGTIAEADARIDLGAKVVLVWSVLAPRDARIEPGLLAQKYVIGSKGASTPPGMPSVLVGQQHKAIMLQQVTTDPTAADTRIASLTLRLQMTPA